MDASVLQNLSATAAAVWGWCAERDPRTTYVLGAATAVVAGRIFSVFANPAQKVLAFAGFILVAAVALSMLVSYVARSDDMDIPFGKAVHTPNAETLSEIEK